MPDVESQDITDRSKFFLESLNKDQAEKIAPYIERFESCCILSNFEEAVLVIPFDIGVDKEDPYVVGLRGVFDYMRQVIIAKLGEKMLVDAVYKNDKASKEAASILVQRITADPTDGGSGGFPAIPNINVNFV